MVTYRLVVYANTYCVDSRKSLYERILEISAGVTFPFQLMLDSMHVLYGDNSIVSFEVLGNC